MKKTEKAARGQTVITETSPTRENESALMNENECLMGRKMGGGPTDLSASLSGSEKTVNYMDDAPKSRK